MASLAALEAAVRDGVTKGMTAAMGGRGGASGASGGDLLDRTASNIFRADMLSQIARQAQAAMHAGTQMGNVYQNASIAEPMRMPMMAEQLPFGVGSAYGTGRGFGQMWTGESEQIRQSQMRFGISSMTQPAQFRLGMQGIALGMEADTARARAGAYGSISVPSIASFDQTTVGGQFAQHEEFMRAPHRAASAMADAEVRAAREAHGAAGARLREATATADRDDATAASAQRIRVNAFGSTTGSRSETLSPLAQAGLNTAGLGFIGHAWNLSRPGSQESQADLTGATNNSVLAAQRAERSRQAQAEAAHGERSTGTNLVQAEAMARQQLIESLRTETQIMVQRTQRLEGTARSLGHMQPVDRRIAVNSIARARQNGWDSLTPQERSSVMSVDPTLGNTMAEQSGENSPEWQMLRGMRGTTVAETPGSLSENRQGVVDMQNQLQQAEIRNRQQMMAGLAQVTERGNTALIQALEAGYTSLVRRIEEMFARINSGLR